MAGVEGAQPPENFGVLDLAGTIFLKRVMRNNGFSLLCMNSLLELCMS